MAPEKRGKTWLLMDIMLQAHKQNKKVLLFQAGDMTENQQIARMMVSITKHTNRIMPEDIYVPVIDCIKNQCNDCALSVRECDLGVFAHIGEKELRENQPTKMQLIEAYKDNPEYKPCINCSQFAKSRWGTVFVVKRKSPDTLTINAAQEAAERYFTKDNIRISTHSNGTLSVYKMKTIIKKLKAKNFEPDIVLVDYGDLLVDFSVKEERHKQNQIWKDMRGCSQEYNNLWIVPTQTDADSYEKDTIKQKNFSEDKRKYGHVTAMFGLNQDNKGREKEIGIIRVNKILVREGENTNEQVHVIQRLEIGRPIVTSYF
jgi:ferredoxin